ncbi:MAG: efflux RND transporter permease subunit, partial [Desulfobacterales bacterium]|nr:efflux RND transporter permease subunit [Desulfobacterales bacterium]
GGAIVRLSDVSRIEIGSQSYNFDSRVNGISGSCAAVQLAPGANALNTVQGVRQRLEELSATVPADMEVSVPYDTSRFVSVAIEKVIHTLGEAVVLVFIVILLFLQNFRYTLIPTIVVPVCLLGTLALMWAFGFSVNMMTMFAMVLAIGILVDDAIVVVENVERTMAEEGLSPKAATRKSMKQISGAVVGITLVLSAVFFPLAFMSGSVGIIYRQFSMVMAISIIISGFLALTMTPALCATMLKPVPRGHGHEKKGFFGLFNRVFGRITGGYTRLTSGMVTRRWRVMCLYACLAGFLGYTYMGLPQSFVPAEDQGTLLVNVQLPPNATYGRTLAVTKNMEDYLMSRPAMESVITVIGFSFSGMGQNAALAFPTLRDWSERGPGQSAMDEARAANMFLFGNKDGAAFAVNPPPVDGLGNAGGFSLRLQDRVGLGRDRLTRALNQVLARANQNPAIAYAMVEGLPDAPQLRLTIDRQKAEALGVSFSAISTVVSTAFGSAMINDYVNRGRVQKVVVQADAESRLTPDSVDGVYVPNNRGEQVPLTAFTRVSWETGPVQVVRYNGFPCFRIGGDAAPGYSTGQAMAEMEKIVAELPAGIGYEWTGLSFQEKFAGAQAPRLFGLALLVVFLLLVALYESWSIPFSVMLIVPIGALGAALATTYMGMANDVYFKVGLITIIGLSAKNAILIAEFAKELMEQGHGLVASAMISAKTRFRPIIMTSMAFILGVVPMAIATGAGAASQRAIGTGVIGGMLAATLLGVLFAPVFFVWVLSLFRRRSAKFVQPMS